MAGTHARDKEAVVGSLLICEMATEAKAQVVKRFSMICRRYTAIYGYYRGRIDSFTLKGIDGLEKISSMMFILCSSESTFPDIERIIDYNRPLDAEQGFGTFPTANVLKYVLTDGIWIVIRPFGSEPIASMALIRMRLKKDFRLYRIR